MNSKFIVILSLMLTVSANAKSYDVNFGLVLKNHEGEPVGFHETREIPLQKEPALYALIVTRKDLTPFVLGTVHRLPSHSQQESKVMGKPMLIERRGAVFMQTSQNDVAGQYSVEVYVDNKLIKTIDYSIVNLTPSIKKG